VKGDRRKDNEDGTKLRRRRVQRVKDNSCGEKIEKGRLPEGCRENSYTGEVSASNLA